TVRLVGVGVSPDRPVPDRRGTFNYAVDQGHYFFRGAIPPGTYSAVVTAPGGRSASASFRVGPVGSPPPPPVAPELSGAPQVLLPGAPRGIGQQPQVGGGDDTALDQDPDGNLVR